MFDSSEKFLGKVKHNVAKINALEDEYKALSDDMLKQATTELKQNYQNGQTLDAMLVPAFALVREGAKRAIGQRPFDVQLLGGMALHFSKIAEMKTGEGKTLTATMPAFLNALSGKGVHIVTTNDYLARRDREWMGKIYEFLGLTVGCIYHDASYEERRKSYHSDITYGTNNEFGFDYLRDNMARHPSQLVQRELNYAIVDEVDSILIDEARTPLIISGPAEESTELYVVANKIIVQLNENDFSLDEKNRNVVLTPEGVEHAEKILNLQNLYGPENVEINRHLSQALKAHKLFKNEVDYIVKDDEIIIVDEFTGRLMFGRRYSDGLHQAIEAKEGLKVRQENQTLATITFQNYFRLFDKLAGMTGTAKTEEDEFREIYGLEVVVVPTNRPMVRKDHADIVWKTEKSKYRHIVDEVVDCHKRGQPVLIGTRSIEKSEMLSAMLKKKMIPHEVLNAKYHEKEAAIIAKAGEMNAVTIATNMAGRGVDIALSQGVVQLGGLHILGTERHESRRIDNQLRGRSGRQGDAGSSRFHLSLEDELIRIFSGERLQAMFNFLKIDEDMPLEHPLLTRTIENAQKKVEMHNFDIRKYVIEYDNVLNKQREIIYGERHKVLHGENLQETVLSNLDRVTQEIINRHAHRELPPGEWDLKSLQAEFMDLTAGVVRNIEFETHEDLVIKAKEAVHNAYKLREDHFEPEMMREVERYVLLYVVDHKWKDHLYNMDNLREGIGLRSYAQKNPIQEYQNEAFNIFEQMLNSVWEETVKYIFRVELQDPSKEKQQKTKTNENAIKDQSAKKTPEPASERVTARSSRPSDSGHVDNAPIRRDLPKVGRNDPCPCGSGKKYKNCCGENK
jgi:preprotein translocase subunit SecA